MEKIEIKIVCFALFKLSGEYLIRLTGLDVVGSVARELGSEIKAVAGVF